MRKNILMPVSALILLAINLTALNTIYSQDKFYSIVSWAVILFSVVISGIVAFKKLNDK